MLCLTDQCIGPEFVVVKLSHPVRPSTLIKQARAEHFLQVTPVPQSVLQADFCSCHCTDCTRGYGMKYTPACCGEACMHGRRMLSCELGGGQLGADLVLGCCAYRRRQTHYCHTLHRCCARCTLCASSLRILLCPRSPWVQCQLVLKLLRYSDLCE